MPTDQGYGRPGFIEDWCLASVVEAIVLILLSPAWFSRGQSAMGIGTLAAAVTPIPYKVFTIASGVFKFPFLPFMLASIIGRSFRFFLVGGVIYILGPKVRTLIEKYFDWLAWALLILGAPGTGKTTMLLELASGLLNRAARDPDHPIPVVFHLSSWALRRRSLAEWMMDELNKRYDVPRKVAQGWVEKEAILPLLDGLDEVAAEHQAGCAEAINVYRHKHGLVPMAVCSRTQEFEALRVELRLRGAIAIEPLDREQGIAEHSGRHAARSESWIGVYRERRPL